MPSALTLPMPGEATASSSVSAQMMRAAQEEARRKAAQEARQEAENARQDAQLKLSQQTNARAQEEADTKRRTATAVADASEWTQNPQYRVPFAKAPEEAKRHFSIDTYGEAAPSARLAWDASLRQQGVPIDNIADNEEITINPEGGLTRHTQLPPASTTGQITAKDVANEGIDPNSIPQSQWATAVANARKSREGKMTEMQSNALQYSARMASNRQVLENLEKRGFDPASNEAAIKGNNLFPNKFRDTQQQQYLAARDNWISALLRKESGAAISRSEYENAYRQYFPQWGDSPEVKEQKAQLRRIAEDNMKLVAGGKAAEAETGAPAPSTAPQQQPAPVTNEPTATNPRTGQKVVYRDGKWQPL